MIVTGLLALLSLLVVAFGGAVIVVAKRRGELAVSAEAGALGFITNFFDTLGIGSYAPSTAWLKLRGLVPDSYIPAVLNVGHAVPTFVEALIFIRLVRVDPWLLAACIAAASAGAIVGAPVITRLPVRAVQGVVGVALVLATAAFVLTNLHLMPGGGTTLSLSPPLFALAVGLYFVLGALMMCGIGLYAPSLVMFSLLGLDTRAAFPIMMGACAFLMPAGSVGFLRARRIDLRVVLSIAIGGVPAVVLAALVVKSLPLTAIRWGVVVVVFYTACLLLRAALKGSPAPAAAVAA
ncbi:MAG TPA: permease [Caulobacteraceae bacterium]|jgi:hypothetical protein|nr:permease [Caulobacteraceae bacterium]